jgi:hypothetical protein
LKNGKPPPNLPEWRNVEGDRRKIEEVREVKEVRRHLHVKHMSELLKNNNYEKDTQLHNVPDSDIAPVGMYVVDGGICSVRRPAGHRRTAYSSYAIR